MIQVFTWALPIFSSYLIGLRKSVPCIWSGNKLFLLSIFTPKSLKGFITLEKSLFDKLLSPTNFILEFDLTNKPSIILAKVPELPAFNTVLFLILNPFRP